MNYKYINVNNWTTRRNKHILVFDRVSSSRSSPLWRALKDNLYTLLEHKEMQMFSNQGKNVSVHNNSPTFIKQETPVGVDKHSLVHFHFVPFIYELPKWHLE